MPSSGSMIYVAPDGERNQVQSVSAMRRIWELELLTRAPVCCVQSEGARIYCILGRLVTGAR